MFFKPPCAPRVIDQLDQIKSHFLLLFLIRLVVVVCWYSSSCIYLFIYLPENISSSSVSINLLERDRKRVTFYFLCQNTSTKMNWWRLLIFCFFWFAYFDENNRTACIYLFTFYFLLGTNWAGLRIWECKLSKPSQLFL